jgi:hypothetical protein
MHTKTLTLTEDIARLLRIELGDAVSVICPDGKVTIMLSTVDCETNYGAILQQIHRVIDECHPERTEHLFIRISAREGTFQNVTKIWKSA